MRNHRAVFRLLMIVIVCLLILTTSQTAQQQQVKPPTSRTQVVLLGTGNPAADPDRSGPATAIVDASIAWRPAVDNQRSRPEELLSEMITRYSGHVVVGRDLDVY